MTKTSVALSVGRKRCRNPRCRQKLPRPTDNDHHAFCCCGCHASFYFNRCRVCEAPLRDKRGGRLYCRPPKKCRQEAAKWPPEIAPEPTGHGLPLSKCEAYNRVYEQSYGSS